MKFAITWTIHSEAYDRAITRFLDTGAPPPEGVKVLGRWHALNGSSSGYIIAETSDVKAVYRWIAQWNDVCAFTVMPVIEDADAAEILKSTQRKS